MTRPSDLDRLGSFGDPGGGSCSDSIQSDADSRDQGGTAKRAAQESRKDEIDAAKPVRGSSMSHDHQYRLVFRHSCIPLGRRCDIGCNYLPMSGSMIGETGLRRHYAQIVER